MSTSNLPERESLPDMVAHLVGVAEWMHDRFGSPQSRLLTLEAAAFIQQIASALPVCPTCEGIGHLGPATGAAQADYGRACPDCTDGRMDVFRALAIARAVMATTYDHLAWTTDQVKAGQYDPHPIIAHLRAVKP